jgi:hypothetical protein
MDWQQAAALGIVAMTAFAFLYTRLRKRRFEFKHDTHCGCSSPSTDSRPKSITFTSRRGERPRIIVKEG